MAPSLARGWRWQALLKELSQICPETAVFTGLWPGFTRGFEGTIKVSDQRKYRFIGWFGSDPRLCHGFAWISPLILADLFKFRPHIIITNGFHICSLYALIVKWILGSHVVLLWQGISAETGGNSGSLRLVFRRIMAKFFDFAISNTKEGMKYLHELVKIPPEKVTHFVGEVADRESFPVLSQGANPLASLRRPVFLFVGSMIRAKGVRQLLKATAGLVRAGHRDFSLVLVGEGGEREELQQLAKQLEITPWVTWAGFVPYERLGPFYEGCDVLVLPSLEDTWGVVVAEAMSFGKPVICSCQAGSSELVEHGRNGFLFNAYEPEELGGHMAKFISNPQLITEFGSNSQALAAVLTPKQAARKLAFLLAKFADRETAMGISQPTETTV